MAERRKRITEAQGKRFTKLLEALPIRISEPLPCPIWSNAVTAAREHGLSVYDGSYLDLAMQEGIPLATRDKVLIKAAKIMSLFRS